MSDEKLVYVVIEWDYHSSGTSMEVDSVWSDKQKAFDRAGKRQSFEHSRKNYQVVCEVKEATLDAF